MTILNQRSLSLVINLFQTASQKMKECLGKCFLNQRRLFHSTLLFLSRISFHMDLIENLPFGLGSHINVSSPPYRLELRQALLSKRAGELVGNQFQENPSMAYSTFAYISKTMSYIGLLPYLSLRGPYGCQLSCHMKVDFPLSMITLCLDLISFLKFNILFHSMSSLYMA